ncbi:NAD(P)H-dependent oxidoreductase [Sphingomonas sp. H39-1-10]|uniref:NADPH-dependent FMN reductase n=1 Tax=Sphingomonas TaxID=13687 RepID=UPI00088AA83E|nr:MULTISPECIES: NAD(P)H-dependent oxidoreductase [Sphingomonas]MDF0489948.1 NAD(P)H-dependent oxidoreductase [Sphingomonas pollutisoli]SDA36933.1 NAD(P)H-dependent FMN reductase [Sphingomonas sp. NFR15]
MAQQFRRLTAAIVVGSLRAESLNLKVGKSIAALARDRIDFEIANIADLPLYNEDLDPTPPAEWGRFREQIARMDGVVFCTPEYNRGVPGALKNAIDVGSRPPGEIVWAEKPTAVISVSPYPIGGFGANHQVRQLCAFLDMPMLQQPEAYLGRVTPEKFGADGVVTDEPLRELLSKIVDAYAGWLSLTRARSEA